MSDFDAAEELVTSAHKMENLRTSELLWLLLYHLDCYSNGQFTEAANSLVR